MVALEMHMGVLSSAYYLQVAVAQHSPQSAAVCVAA